MSTSCLGSDSISTLNCELRATGGTLGTERSRTSLLVTPAAMVVNLLVRGQYDVIESMTEGRNLSSEALRRAIDAYGRRLVSIPDTEWEAFEATPVPDSTPTVYRAAVRLWTQEEGESDLTIQLAF